MTVGAVEVRAAAGCALAALGTAVDADWTVPVPHLEWTVAQTVAHLARAALWCGVDLAAGSAAGDERSERLQSGPDLAAVSIEVDAAAPPAALLDAVGAGARLTAAAVLAAPSGALGYDPDGPADASGFAGMCCDELLVHGWDAAQGLGVEVRPDPALAAAVLARLFPWLDPPDDPWPVLLWANGRIDLPGRPRNVHWRAHVKPLAQWDPASGP
jgi:uncharacterized protein (TIGR03083 family)